MCTRAEVYNSTLLRSAALKHHWTHNQWGIGCSSAAGVSLGSFSCMCSAVQRWWWCWKRGLEKCLLMSPFLFTVTRKRKAPVVLVPSISPGLWSIQGLNWIINQTHVSARKQDTGISWNDHLQDAPQFTGWSFHLEDMKSLVIISKDGNLLQRGDNRNTLTSLQWSVIKQQISNHFTDLITALASMRKCDNDANLCL